MMREFDEPRSHPKNESPIALPEKKDGALVPTAPVRRQRSINRLALTSTFLALTLAACSTIEQPAPVVQPEQPQPTVWVSPTPFQPSPPTEIATQVIAMAPGDNPPMPVVETLLPEFAPTAQPEVVAEDPLFLDRNSVVLRNPTEIMQTPEQAEYIANAVLQRLRDLGYVQDTGLPVTVSFNGTPDASICEANSITRHIECENDPRQYLRPDASMIVHELLHIVENDSPTSNIGELRAVMGAFIISGRNPYIHDRYLFATGFEVDGAPVVFSASDIVNALEAQGISQHEMLNFVFNYDANWQRITQGAIGWMNGVADFTQNSEYIIARTYKEGYGFLNALTQHRWAINPYNNLLTPETPIDACRANSAATADLLALDKRVCVISR